jgi:probable F420-dependent oxidoreductase
LVKLWQVVSFAEPDQLLGIARAAEEAGLEGVLLSDHLFFPGRIDSRYPYSADGKPAFDGTTPFPEPWTTIAAMAAVTTRLRFATMVYILPLRHPLEVAKAVGTAALLSGGRVALGVGAGWIREEFDVLGVDFSTRGTRMDEMIDVMRQAWTGAMVEHSGRFFQFAPLQMSPPPPAPPPIWVGGLSRAALRRAATRGDGWIGTGQTPGDAVSIVAELGRLRAEAGRGAAPFEAIVPLVVPPDRDLLARLSDAGVTATTLWPFSYTIGPATTLAQKRDAMLRAAAAFSKGTEQGV